MRAILTKAAVAVTLLLAVPALLPGFIERARHHRAHGGGDQNALGVAVGRSVEALDSLRLHHLDDTGWTT